MIQDEYYIISRENNNSYPLFAWDMDSSLILSKTPIVIKEPIRLRLRKPISAHFEWVDFHLSPYPVFSQHISKALMPINIYGIQFIPTKVRHPKLSDEIKDYYLMHVWNQISCLDTNKSELDYDEVDGQIWDIEKLVLDEDKLENIDLSKRLIFELKEKTSVLLVHQSIKAIILELKPKGCRFFPIKSWYSDIIFD